MIGNTMNSVIISMVISFWNNFKKRFTKSKIWAFISNINNACKRKWQKSIVMTFLRGKEKTSLKSKALNVIFLPFTILEFFSGKFGTKLAEGVNKSALCELGRKYINGFMAVNTRFWGLMGLAMSASFNIYRIANGMEIHRAVLILSAVSAIFTIVNYNITGFLETSFIAGFIKKCAGAPNLTFNFYDEKKASSIGALISALIIGAVSGAVAASVSIIGILIPFAAFGMLLVLQYPVTGVYAAVFVAPLIPFSSMPLAGICIWTMLSLVIKSLITADFKWKRDGLGAALILFLAVLLVSCIFSFAMKASLVVWMMYFVFISFYFAIINTVTTRAQLYGLLRVLVISAALVALYGVMQYVFGWTTKNAWIDEEMFEEETMRVFSTLANPNVLGEYLLLVLPVSVAFFLKDRAKSLSKWVYLLISGVIFLCLILTQSRGCWLGFALSVAVFVTFYEGRLWSLIPLALCILPFVIPQTIVDRLLSIGDMNDSSTSYRVFIWMGTFGMLRHYIFGGIGMGEAAFNEVYPFFSYNAIIAPHSHNTYLQLLVEAGIPALAVFVAIIVIYLQNTRRIYKQRNKKTFNSTMALALGAGVCGFLLQSLFDYTFYNYRVMAVFFMILGITMCFRYVYGRKTA